jgi:hypothetical protein
VIATQGISLRKNADALPLCVARGVRNLTAEHSFAKLPTNAESVGLIPASAVGFTGQLLRTLDGQSDPSPPFPMFVERLLLVHRRDVVANLRGHIFQLLGVLPDLVEQTEVGGREGWLVHLVDEVGGIGGWRTMQGNTPAEALLDAGCNMLIVSHLSDDSPWSRRDFSQATVLEIRPQRAISRDPSLLDHRDLLGFDPKRIPSWIAQGYDDTLACAHRVMRPDAARRALRESEKILEAKQTQSVSNEARLADSMARLRRY